MTRSVDQVLESIDAQIEDVLHDIMMMDDERGYEVDEHMIELTILVDQYRKLRRSRDLNVLDHRTREQHVN